MKEFKFLSTYNDVIEERMREYENHLNEIERGLIDGMNQPTPHFDRPHPLRQYDEVVLDMIDYCGESRLFLNGYDRDVDNDEINIRVENSNLGMDGMVTIDYRVYYRLTTNVEYRCLRISYQEWSWRLRER